MRTYQLGLSAMALTGWLTLVGCGESAGDSGGAKAGAAGQASGGDAGTTSAGEASGGSSTGGAANSAGKTSGGSEQAGSSAGGSSAGGAAEPGGEGGAPSSSGGAGGLVECDPKQALCKLLPGECPPMQVREVVGTCWGDCVKIDRCECSSAAECPDPNQYTCWMSQHCGPYVK